MISQGKCETCKHSFLRTIEIESIKCYDCMDNEEKYAPMTEEQIAAEVKPKGETRSERKARYKARAKASMEKDMKEFEAFIERLKTMNAEQLVVPLTTIFTNVITSIIMGLSVILGHVEALVKLAVRQKSLVISFLELCIKLYQMINLMLPGMDKAEDDVNTVFKSIYKDLIRDVKNNEHFKEMNLASAAAAKEIENIIYPISEEVPDKEKQN